MHKRIGLMCLVTVMFGMTTLSVYAGTQWAGVGEFKTGGDAKEVRCNVRVDRCRIVCLDGTVVINTVVVRAGGVKKPVTVAMRLTAGQKQEVVFPSGAMAVTGLRISDAGDGRYRVEVPGSAAENQEADGKGEVASAAGGGLAATVAKNTIDSLQQRAKKGDVAAQADLGMAYCTGDGVMQDYAEGARWFMEAAQKGNASAQTSLGNLYNRGLGVEQDHAQALVWYRKAAAQGYPFAQCKIGYVYMEGRGVTKDLQEAAVWFRKAAEQGNGDAQNQLGNAYLNGWGVPRDARQAVDWYRKSADSGFGWGLRNLGLMYYNGSGVAQDYVEAAKWYRLAAAKGNTEAICSLGSIHALGRAMPRDPVAARKFYLQAAEKGLPRAQSKLAFCHLNGEGGATNLAEAVLWFERAADGEWPEAMRALGELYLAGRGVPKDRTAGVAWLRKAAAKNDQPAKQLLASLEDGGGQPLTVMPKEVGTTTTTTVNAHGQTDVKRGKPGSLRWKSKLTEGTFRELSGPAVGPDGSVYVPARGADATLEAFASDGPLKWRFKDGHGELKANSTPLVGSDGTVYACDNDKVFAIAPDGKCRWVRSLGRAALDLLLADDGRMILAGCVDARKIEALATESGRTVRTWEWQDDKDLDQWLFMARDGGLYAGTRKGVIVFRPDGSRGKPPVMYLGAGDHPVEAVDGTLYYCDSGSVRLRRPDGTETNFIGTVFRDEFYYTPVMGPDGTVYVTGRKPDDDTGLLVALAPDLMLRWERRLPRRWDASPVVGSDGVVYAGSADGTVYATDAQGRPLWEFRAQGAVGPIVMGADGTLYFGCDRESELYALWTGSPGPVGSGKGEGIHEPGGKPVPSGGEPANDGIPAMPD